MRKVFSLILVLFSLNAFALVAGPARIEGTIKSFDDKILTLEGKAVTYQIPRDFVGQKSLKAGEKISVLLSMEQAGKVKFEQIKKK